MVSTPKITNKKATSNIDQNKFTFGEDSKMNMMSNTFCQYMDAMSYEPTSMKSGGANDATLFGKWLSDDLEHFLSEGEDNLKFPETPSMSYDVSPVMSSSMTTPSMVFDNISTPQALADSPLFGSIPTSFSTSPLLEPALGFFPELIGENEAKSFMHLTSIAPSVAIPADDHSMPIRQPDLTSALNIPWGSDVNNASSIIGDETASIVTLINSATNIPNNLTTNTKAGSDHSSAVLSTSDTNTIPTSAKNTVGRTRKRSLVETEKDSETHAEELAIKRAKNTDAARRSRLRKVMKMESLERQVSDFKDENNDLQTRIAVLESEKKGLEEKNVEKDNRIRMLEQQLAEAHERLITRSS
ncbi:3030_t:CDS:1 [Acaulospora morrowiae]|uniref:3030_t:CDS:1 n=1 Tax=Acaulospora morrowiae TaxID=94023 RepID=A0A9N9J2E1_9GLOM|nr:3030_t:CDS:1 [Acaulospora morrowiae]